MEQGLKLFLSDRVFAWQIYGCGFNPKRGGEEIPRHFQGALYAACLLYARYRQDALMTVGDNGVWIYHQGASRIIIDCRGAELDKMNG